MATCNDCSAIEPDKRGAAGHPHLVSLGEVRSMEAARRGARQELFVCARCDTGGSTPTTSVTKPRAGAACSPRGSTPGLMRA